MKTIGKLTPVAVTALALTLITTLGACGLTAPKRHEGYADVSSPGVWDTDREISISLGPTLLRFAASTMDEDDQETAELLRGLDGVRVRIYEIDGDAAKVATRMDRMKDDLLDDDWQPVAIIREDDEVVNLLVRADHQQVHGLVVLVADGDSEAIIVNLMGDIQPEFFSEVTVALDIDVPPVEVDEETALAIE